MAQFTIRQEQTGSVGSRIDYSWVFQDNNQLSLAISATRYSTPAEAKAGIDSLLRALTTGIPVVEEVARPTVATANRVLGDVSFSVERSSDIVSLASPTVELAPSPQEAQIIQPPSQSP